MPLNLSNHKAIDTYYAALQAYRSQDITHEQATRLAFSMLLDAVSKTAGWTLVLEQTLANRKRPDGTLYDDVKFPRGYWEAKDTHDDLDAEIKAKIARGYPLTNTIFEDTRRAVLYQNNRQVFEADLNQRGQLIILLNQFFSYTGEQIEEFHAAVQEFRERIPELARSVEQTIEDERTRNQRFAAAFDAFQDICRQSIDPNIGADEIEKMLVQHLLTERLFRTVFDDADFTRRNAIANEIEKVIRTLTWNRNTFLRRLDPFYLTIEDAARTINDFAQKQTFLNTVYERFFQGFSKDQADTHGIVYTPQPIVDFMVASVDEVLQKEFGLSLSSEGVKILDPSTGTGNFIVNILRRINRRDLKRKYREELFANEIMLLPYYIASLNVEHAYYDLTGEYESFEGICFADTLDMAESQQLSFFVEENTERVRRQKEADITVIIGNPPYNVGQRNENDNNKNRKYKVVDERVRQTYAQSSSASNKNALGDAYVKFFRWATDRLGNRDGIVCFVSNNSFVDGIAFDGFRRNLIRDFTKIYHLDLKGNARTSGELRRAEGGNIFDDAIRTGVGITILIRNTKLPHSEVLYHTVGDYKSAIEKREHLTNAISIDKLLWQPLIQDTKGNWLISVNYQDFDSFLPIGTKDAKSKQHINAVSVFKTYSNGVKANRDYWVYDFDYNMLQNKIKSFIEIYNSEVDRWQRRENRSVSVDNFVIYDDAKIKWSRDLKLDLQRARYITFNTQKIRRAFYRPFCQQYLYFDRILNEEVYTFPKIFPTAEAERENVVINLTGIGSEKPFIALMTDKIADLHFAGIGAASSQCFPLYTYSEDGSNRCENITDWGLKQFQGHYGPQVTKRDIFNYVYAVLHSPQYRERYAESLKRELPRIPFVSRESFPVFVDIGARLADLHMNYEQVKEYSLQWVENKDVPFSWRVKKMQLSKDKTQIKVNESLTLAGIPAECFEYRLGNLSALEWVIDQYQVSTDKRSGIASDPNRADEEEYIVHLIGRIVTVSVEAVKLVKALPLVIEEVSLQSTE